jgi:hypothetical protein
MPEDSPLKSFADFPGSIDAFIDGLIGFVYKIVSTFLAVIFSPKWGSLRARANPLRFAKPASALFVSIALVSITSFLGPSDIPKLLEQDKHEILSWIIDVVVTYFILDLGIYICARIVSRRRRTQSRTISILRYAAAGTMAGWFAVAAVHLSVPYLMADGSGRWANFLHFLLSPAVLKLVGWLTYLPLVGGICVVGWSNSKPLKKNVVNIAAMASVLAAFTFFVDTYSLRVMYSLVRVVVPRTVENSSEPRLTQLENRPHALVRPLVCRLHGSGEMQIEAAISNPSDVPLAIDMNKVDVWVERSDFNLVNPDFLKVPIKTPKQRILVLGPRSGQSLSFDASLPASELSNIINICNLEYRDDGGNERIRFESDSSPIEHTALRGSRK